MIKFVQCVRRKPGMSRQEFAEHWAAYAQTARSIAAASDGLRCTTTTPLPVEQNVEIMKQRGTKAPYDGLLEIWWVRENDVVAFMDSGAGDKLIDELRRAQEAFMDLPNCSFFFAAEDA
ncbi:MAG: EthD domain-containing protein [Polyangiales bacterium]